MGNITISINDDLLKLSREYVKKHNISLNALIRKFLQDTVTNKSDNWLDSCFSLMDKTNGNSGGKKWKREDLYRVLGFY